MKSAESVNDKDKDKDKVDDLALIRQSNLTTGRIVAAHGRFSGIRQVARVCTPSNTYFRGPIRAQIPIGISIDSAVFTQLTADCPL